MDRSGERGSGQLEPKDGYSGTVMLHQSRVRLTCLAVFLLGAGVPAQAWVELLRVPERIDGPLGEGRNLLVTVRVSGDLAEEVWLGLSGGSEPRVALQQVGVDRWQLNLAVGEAAELLAGEGSGEVRVFARRGERVSASVALAFDVGPVLPGRRGRTEHEEFLPFPSGLVARILVEDARHGMRAFVVGSGGAVWEVPEDVEALRVLTLADEGQTAAELRVANEHWPLTSERPKFAAAQLPAAAATAWRESGTLAVVFPSGEEVLLRAVPRVLEVGAKYAFVVGQRQALELPGSGGALEVSLGDITRGQVLLEVWTRDAEEVLAGRSVHAGDRLRVTHGGEAYVLDVVRLTNFLLGDDFAELTVVREEK